MFQKLFNSCVSEEAYSDRRTNNNLETHLNSVPGRAESNYGSVAHTPKENSFQSHNLSSNPPVPSTFNDENKRLRRLSNHFYHGAYGVSPNGTSWSKTSQQNSPTNTRHNSEISYHAFQNGENKHVYGSKNRTSVEMKNLNYTNKNSNPKNPSDKIPASCPYEPATTTRVEHRRKRYRKRNRYSSQSDDASTNPDCSLNTSFNKMQINRQKRNQYRNKDNERIENTPKHMSQSYNNIRNLNRSITTSRPHYHSDNDILDEDVVEELSNKHYQNTPTIFVLKKQKRRRKTYSSVEDMLDWDMHSDTSEVSPLHETDIMIPPPAISQRQYALPKSPVLLQQVDIDGDNQDVFSSGDRDTTGTFGIPVKRIYSHSVSTDPANLHSSFHDDHMYAFGNDGNITGDSVFSLNNVGISPSWQRTRSLDGSKHSLYGKNRSKSAHVSDNQFRYFTDSQFGLHRLMQTSNQDLSDVLIDKADLKTLVRLCSGRNYVIYSGCMTCRDQQSFSYLKPVCLQVFQALNNNADRINLLQNVAEIRMLKHQNILEVLGACIDGDRTRLSGFHGSSKPEVLVVTEWTHCQVNLHRLLNWCDEYNPGLMTEYCVMGVALQICHGLLYLESLEIIHNNLTTSTIMLDGRCVIKLSGIEPHGIKQRSAPYRWVAQETHMGISTCSSIVWSFGVVLWSVKMFGEKPYNHLRNSSEIYNYLSQGKRLDKPSNCCDKLYEWMMACWRKNPSDRPNFYQIKSFIERYMETLPKTPQPEDLFPNDEQLWALNGDSA